MFIVRLWSSLCAWPPLFATLPRAPSNVSTIIHILYLPEEAKGENVQFQWKQESLRVDEVYEACWALDNILVINAAHRQVILEDNLDPVDTGNWLFFPGATVKVWTLSSLLPLETQGSLSLSFQDNFSPTQLWVLINILLSHILPFKGMMSLCKRHFFIHSFYNCLRTQIGLNPENIITKRRIHFFPFCGYQFHGSR